MPGRRTRALAVRAHRERPQPRSHVRPGPSRPLPAHGIARSNPRSAPVRPQRRHRSGGRSPEVSSPRSARSGSRRSRRRGSPSHDRRSCASTPPRRVGPDRGSREPGAHRAAVLRRLPAASAAMWGISDGLGDVRRRHHEVDLQRWEVCRVTVDPAHSLTVRVGPGDADGSQGLRGSPQGGIEIAAVGVEQILARGGPWKPEALVSHAPNVCGAVPGQLRGTAPAAPSADHLPGLSGPQRCPAVRGPTAEVPRRSALDGRGRGTMTKVDHRRWPGPARCA